MVGERVEIRVIDVTTKPRRLEGNLPRTGKRIGEAWTTPITHDPELFYQFRHRVSECAEVALTASSFSSPRSSKPLRNSEEIF